MSRLIARFELVRPGFHLDVDLSVPCQGITALLGASGSGKTSVLRCIAGLEYSPKGFLSVNGDVWQNEAIWLRPHQRPLGYVFQEASLFSHLDVIGNLHYGMRRVPDAQRGNLDQVVDLLGIAHLLRRKPEQLSGGEKQRVGIARALLIKPRLLLMDEPLAALDFQRKQEILPYLERLHDELAIPILYVSHSHDEVARLADHLVVLENGRVVLNSPLTEALARPDFPIQLGEDVGAVLEGEVAEIDPAWHLARIEFDGGSLWTRDHDLPVGKKTRLRILARDVSLAREHPAPSSIQNILQGSVTAIADDKHPGLALVQVRVGNSLMIARLTRRALAMLEVSVGERVWVQIKSVALI